MERSESGPHDIWSSKGGSPYLCQLRTVSVVPLQRALSCVLTHMGCNPPQKHSSLTVVELDDTLPCFMDDRRDSVRATHGLPGEVFAWKTTLGRGRTWSRLFDSHRERWPLVWPSWLTCVMFRLFSLAR
jgi:hypothetical protein